MADEPRPSLRDAMTNWRASSLPLARRLGIALRNWSRRLRIPPRDCCGNYGEPGCWRSAPEPGLSSND